MSEEHIIVTESNKQRLEDDYTQGKIISVIHAKRPFPGKPIGFSDEFRKQVPHFDFNIGDTVVRI